jgi:hypothetical protein
MALKISPCGSETLAGLSCRVTFKVELLTYFVDRIFLLITGPLWGFAIPALTVLLAVRFRQQH